MTKLDNTILSIATNALTDVAGGFGFAGMMNYHPVVRMMRNATEDMGGGRGSLFRYDTYGGSLFGDVTHVHNRTYNIYNTTNIITQ